MTLRSSKCLNVNMQRATTINKCLNIPTQLFSQLQEIQEVRKLFQLERSPEASSIQTIVQKRMSTDWEMLAASKQKRRVEKYAN